MPLGPPNHQFIGYRGVSNAHFNVGLNKTIRYVDPPAAVAGSGALGRGLYVTNNLNSAVDYAKDSAWNLYANKIRGNKVDRGIFDAQQWKSWGKVHALYAPGNKRLNIADYSDFDFDRLDPSFRNNMMRAVSSRKVRYDGVHARLMTSPMDNLTVYQTVIFPDKLAGLYAIDITNKIT